MQLFIKPFSTTDCTLQPELNNAKSTKNLVEEHVIGSDPVAASPTLSPQTTFSTIRLSTFSYVLQN